MLNNIKAVIFDLDGTLIDSMWLWKSIDIAYLERHGYALPDDLQASIEGMSFTETAAYFKERFKLSDSIETIKDDWNKLSETYYKEKVMLKEAAESFLKYLHANNYKLGIGTSNSKELVRLIVDRFQLGDYIHAIRTSCEVEKGKPSPDVYLKVAEDLGVEPHECLVFEDIPNGIIAANRAGMKSCAIYDDFSKELTVEKKKLADYYIDSYNDILKLIGNEA